MQTEFRRGDIVLYDPAMVREMSAAERADYVRYIGLVRDSPDQNGMIRVTFLVEGSYYTEVYMEGSLSLIGNIDELGAWT